MHKIITLIIFVCILILYCDDTGKKESKSKTLNDTHCYWENRSMYHIDIGTIIIPWEKEEGDFEVIDGLSEVYKLINTCSKETGIIYSGTYPKLKKESNLLLWNSGETTDLANLPVGKPIPKKLEKCDVWDTGHTSWLSWEEKAYMYKVTYFIPRSCDCDCEQPAICPKDDKDYNDYKRRKENCME